jgi:hypothetical protein
MTSRGLVKSKAIPVQVNPEGTRIFRQLVHECDNVVNPAHRPPLTPRNNLRYVVGVETESIPGP